MFPKINEFEIIAGFRVKSHGGSLNLVKIIILYVASIILSIDQYSLSGVWGKNARLSAYSDEIIRLSPIKLFMELAGYVNFTETFILLANPRTFNDSTTEPTWLILAFYDLPLI
jgi:hypothetical protein